MNDLHDASDDIDSPDGTLPDDPVDRLGRTAGAALRRPAPADGVRRLRTARRRQQVTRVAAAGATALVFAAGAFVLTRPDDEQISTATTPTTEVSPTVPTTTPVSTVPTTSSVPSTTAPATVPETVAPTTIAPTTAPPIPTGEPPQAPTISAAFVEWADGQRDAGRPILRRTPGQGTDASIYVASNWAPDGGSIPDGADLTYSGSVVLGDGRVAPLPDGIVPVQEQTGMQLLRLGDRIAAIPVSTSATAVSEPDLLLLDPDTLTWSVGVDLTWAPTTGVFAQARSVDGSVVIGRFGWSEGASGLTPVDGRDAVIVRPDLSVVAVPAAPDNVQTSWTSDSGDLAFSVGYLGSGSGFSYPPTPNIWALDVAANEWVEVPNPEWISCTDCNWKQPGEHGDPFLEVGTDRGLVVRVPDGSIGVFDSVARTWRRLDDAPFDPALPFTTVVGDRVVVAPMENPADTTQNGIVGVLDVAAGTWRTERFPVTDGILNWDIRTADGAALLQPSQGTNETGTIDLAVARVVDADGTWWPVSADDVGAWAASVTGFEAVDLRSVTLG